MSNKPAAIAHLIDAIGSDRMPGALAALLRRVTAIDYVVMFGYRGVARPLPLFDDFPPDRRVVHVDDYVEGPFLLDPFFLASFESGQMGLSRLSDLAPDRYFQSEYYSSYYKQTGLAEEVGFLVAPSTSAVVVVSLMRLEKRFSAAEFRRLAEMEPIVSAACRRQWSSLSQAGRIASPKQPVREMAMTCRQLGDGALTDRESEVAALTLQGHSANAIGAMLGISAGTARIHRQNIYAKLRIGSQSELFAQLRSIMKLSAPPRSRQRTAP